MQNLKTKASKNFLKASAAALTAMTLTGCGTMSSINTPNGTANANYQRHIQENKDSCLTQTSSSFDLLLIRTASTKYTLNQECVEQRIAAMAIHASTNISDPRAQADMQAFGLMLAGLGNERIDRAVDTVANRLSESQRAAFRNRIAEYESSLRAQGAAQAREALMAENRAAIENFNQTTIEIVVPSECSPRTYNNLKREFETAYGHRVVINNTDYSLQRMGLNPQNAEQACADQPAWVQGTKAGGGSIPTVALSRTLYPTPVHSVAAFASSYPNVKASYASGFEARLKRADLMARMVRSPK